MRARVIGAALLVAAVAAGVDGVDAWADAGPGADTGAGADVASRKDIEPGEDIEPGASGDDTAPRPADAFPATLRPAERHDVAVYLSRDQRAGFVTLTRAGRRWTSAIYPMWSAAPADLDGDGVDEIVLGIWSRTRRHDEPEPHRAIWVVSWNGRDLVPLWRGSALARPLVDAFPADLDRDGRAELLSLEQAGARCVLAAYAWNGFGFTGQARLSISCAATLDRQGRKVLRAGRAHRPALRRGKLVLP